MPAPKKDSSIRARRNTASTASTLADGDDVVRMPAPELPDRVDEETGEPRDWHELTLEWWEDLWASPMAGEYHRSDRFALFVLAELMDEFWKHPSSKLAAEIRLQRVAFGLTPYDRRRLEWTIEVTKDAQDNGARRRGAAGSSAKQPRTGDDPRSVLRAV